MKHDSKIKKIRNSILIIFPIILSFATACLVLCDKITILQKDYILKLSYLLYFIASILILTLIFFYLYSIFKLLKFGFFKVISFYYHLSKGQAKIPIPVVTRETKSSDYISIIAQDPKRPYEMCVVPIIEKELLVRGFGSLVSFAHENSKLFADLLLDSQKLEIIKGIIAMPPASGLFIHNFIHDIRLTKPIVCFDRPLEGINCPVILVENVGPSMLQVNTLIEEGYKKIYLVTGDPNIQPQEERGKGYISAMERKGLFSKQYCISGLGTSFNGSEGKTSFNTLTKVINKMRENEGTAIFTTNSKLALKTVEIVVNIKGQWPERFTLLVYDGMEQHKNYLLDNKVNYKQIRQPEQEIADKAVNVLMSLINKKPINTPIPPLHPDFA